MRSLQLAGSALAAQLAQFALVGVSNTLLSVAVFSILDGIGTPPAASAPLGFTAGAVNGYLLNRRWTFRAPDSRRARVRYLAVQLAGLGATSTLAFAGGTAGYLVALPVVTVATFTANRIWTFSSDSQARLRKLLRRSPKLERSTTRRYAMTAQLEHLDAVIRDGIVRGVAVVALAGVALIHVLDAPGTFADAAYKGWLYVGLIVGCLGAAAALVRGSDRRAWLAAFVFPLGAAIAFVVSRAVGLPAGADDIGNWTEPLGLASLFVEGLLVALSGAVLAGRARVRAPARLAVAFGLAR